LLHDLQVTDNWISVVRLLHDQLGLSQAEIARGAGVSQMTVSRWLDSPEDADVRAWGRLDDLRYVTMFLVGYCSMRLRLARFWLSAKNLDLGTDPLSAIASGCYEQVVETARAFANGRIPIA
jgi:hypothetical protein